MPWLGSARILIAKILDLQSWKTQLEQQFMILPALRKESARVKLLAKSALMKITALLRYEETTSLVVAVAQWAKAHASNLNRLFRLQIKDSQTNIAIVNKLLRKIGYKPSSIKREGSREDRQQIWRAKAQPYQAEVWAALERKWTGELAAESIEIKQPSAPVSSICNTENSLVQINDTDPKSPINRRGGSLEMSKNDQLALANLMLRYRSYGNLISQVDDSALSKISAVALERFAAIAV